MNNIVLLPRPIELKNYTRAFEDGTRLYYSESDLSDTSMNYSFTAVENCPD